MAERSRGAFTLLLSSSDGRDEGTMLSQLVGQLALDRSALLSFVFIIIRGWCGSHARSDVWLKFEMRYQSLL